MVPPLGCDEAGAPLVAPWLDEPRGDRVLGDRIDCEASAGLVALHHRTLPDGSGRIDHLVVASTGAWLIDVNHTGKRVALVNNGTRRRREPRLYVAGRDRTNMARVLSRHTDLVQAIVAPAMAGPLTFHRVLCFTVAAWRWPARPFMIEEVLITTPKRLMSSILEGGPLSDDMVQLVGAQLDRRLPHA